MLDFGHPDALLLLLPAAAATAFVYRRRRRTAMLFPVGARLEHVRRTWRLAAAAVCPAVFMLGLVLAVVALARPRTGWELARRTADVIAIEMVVDVSGSMEALDLSDDIEARTRLDVVKEMFAEFVRQRPDDLIGLVTFGGYASTRAPLTADHDALLHVLNGVEIPRQNYGPDGRLLNQQELLTAVGDALATACARLEHAQTASKVIVLLSDGRSNSGAIQPLTAAGLARELGVKVYTIGVGSTGNTPFRDRDVFGRDTVRYSKVILDETLLRELARTTGGRYFNVRDPNGLQHALSEIDELEKTRVEQETYTRYHELFGWFLAPAIVLTAIAAACGMGVSRRVT
jgi:Ca-activated chloride channel family protein